MGVNLYDGSRFQQPEDEHRRIGDSPGGGFF